MMGERRRVDKEGETCVEAGLGCGAVSRLGPSR